MSEHSTLSPSGRTRWALCAPSIREESRYPNESNKYSIDGTHTHTLLAECVKPFLSPASIKVGQTLSDHEGEFVVDEERARRVQVALDYIAERIKDRNATVYSEISVDPMLVVNRADMRGTADLVIVFEDDGEIEIIDYKDGMAPTDAIEQMEQYGVGAICKFRPAEFKIIKLTVIQPKLATKGMPPIKTVLEESVSDFMNRVPAALIAEAEAVSRAMADPNAPFNPGEKQCRWCKHRGNCKALADQSMSLIGVDQISAVESAASKNPSDMSEDQLAKILEAAPLVRSMLDAAFEEALKRSQSGVTIPGFKVVTGRGSRKWALGDDEIEKKLKGMGVPKASIYKTSVVSPAQVEKLTWEKKGEKTSFSKRQLERIDKEYVVHMSGKPTLAPDADHRPSITNEASAMFSPVEQKKVEQIVEKTVDLPDWMS